MTAAPAELAALQERMAELTDLGRIHSMLFWDQNTMMPPNGAAARADHSATLEVISHNKLIDPEIGRLLDALEPWAPAEDPDSDAVRLLAAVRRDHEKAVRVPTELAAEISHADALGQQAWQEARAASDFSRFRDALERHIELRHRYVACFEPAEHPYDILLDDFEPELTTAELRPLFATLRDKLVDLVARAAGEDGAARNDGVFAGPFEVDDQRRAVMDVLEAVGFDADGWRLDPAPHPFAQSLGPTDVRITTRYDLTRLRRRALLRPARVRPRPLRGRHRARAGAQPARPAGLASASTSRRAGCGRTSSAARARSAAGCCRCCASTLGPGIPAASTPTPSTARSTPSSAR